MADVQTTGEEARRPPSGKPATEHDQLPLLPPDAPRATSTESCEDDQTTEVAPPQGPGGDPDPDRTLAGFAPPPTLASLLSAAALAQGTAPPPELLAAALARSTAPPPEPPPEPTDETTEVRSDPAAAIRPALPDPAAAIGPALPDPAAAIGPALPDPAAAIDPALPDPISISQPPRLAPTPAPTPRRRPGRRSRTRLWQGVVLLLSVLLVLVSSGLLVVLLFSASVLLSGS